MPVVRHYSDRVREYLEPKLCEAAVAYKHLDSVHSSKLDKVSVLRAALRKFQTCAVVLGIRTSGTIHWIGIRSIA
jgi:hypothetical protein